MENSTGMKKIAETKGITDSSSFKHDYNHPLLIALLEGTPVGNDKDLVTVQFEVGKLAGSESPLHPRNKLHIATGVFDGSSGLPKCIVATASGIGNNHRIDQSIHNLSIRSEYFGEPKESPAVSFSKALDIVIQAGKLTEIYEACGIYYQRPAEMLNQHETRSPFWRIFVTGTSASKPALEPGLDPEKLIYRFSVNAHTGKVANFGYQVPKISNNTTLKSSDTK